MKKLKARPSLSIYPRDGRVEAFGVPSSPELGIEEPHQSIPNLVVKLYCSDDTVGEVLRKNSSTPGCSSGDGVGLVAQRIRACGYEPRCGGFESLLAHNWPKREGPFPLGVGFEPTTNRLTAGRSTTELLRNKR
ncbi:hypothetical protein F8388_004528, partial [Cannabis sativa]